MNDFGSLHMDIPWLRCWQTKQGFLEPWSADNQLHILSNYSYLHSLPRICHYLYMKKTVDVIGAGFRHPAYVRISQDFPASGATTRCEDGLVGGTETSRRKLRFESLDRKSTVFQRQIMSKIRWYHISADSLSLLYIYMAMSQNPGTVGTLNRWFMPVYSPKNGSNTFWPIPIYIYVYLYCSYTFPPDHKIYSVDQCIICSGICNIYIYYTHTYTTIHVYIHIWLYMGLHRWLVDGHWKQDLAHVVSPLLAKTDLQGFLDQKYKL
jgi:hypothetical protein